jgi:histidine ammonia-lyase
MFLVMTHSGGVGPSLPTPQVRAALAVRLMGSLEGARVPHLRLPTCWQRC